MNSVPYIMIITSKVNACGLLKNRRENTSHDTSSVRPTISHENAWPTHVLTRSIDNNSFCISSLQQKSHPDQPDGFLTQQHLHQIFAY